MLAKALRYCMAALMGLVALTFGAGLFMYASNMAMLDRIYPVTGVSIASASAWPRRSRVSPAG